MKLLLAVVLLAAALASAGPLDHPIFSFFNVFPSAELLIVELRSALKCRVWNAAEIHYAITASATI